MSKWLNLESTFIIVVVTLIASCASPKPEANTSKPNVLFIFVDDLRPELNAYGASHIKSPNLDKLAGKSLVFDRSYCNVPTCGASRASLLSGLRPTRNRFVTYKTKKDLDAPDVISLPMLFKNNGYTTISNGKVYHHADDDTLAWQEIWRPAGQGQDYKLEENLELAIGKARGKPYESAEVADDAYFDGRIANKGISDLQKLKHSEEPFFLALGFKKPHLPFNAPKKYWDMYDIENIKLPLSYVQPESTPQNAFHNFGELRQYSTVVKKGPLSDEYAKNLIHGYYACVSYVDAQIGRVLNEVENLGLAENTIVVLLGDHGWNLGEHMLWCKHCTFETSLRTPLMIRVPDVTDGQHTNSITEYVDIYPSLCELAGIERPAHLQGESVVPIMTDGKRSKNYAVAKFQNAVTLIKGDLFYTEWTDEDGEAYERMLFDHNSDPLELNNVAGSEEYKDLMPQLSKELRERWGVDYLK